MPWNAKDSPNAANNSNRSTQNRRILWNGTHSPRDGVDPKITIHRSCHAMEEQLYNNAMECTAFVQCRHRTNAGSNALLLVVTLVVTPRSTTMYFGGTRGCTPWVIKQPLRTENIHASWDAEHHNAPENHMLHRATRMLKARATRREQGRVDANTSTTTCADTYGALCGRHI